MTAEEEIGCLRALLDDLLMSGLLVQHRMTDEEVDRVMSAVEQASIGEPFEPIGEIASQRSWEGGAEVFEAIGRMLVTWNRTEDAIRGLLETLIVPNLRSDRHVAKILTVHMQPSALQAAINTYASTYEHDELTPRLKAATEYCRRLADYRNEYVHGVRAIKSYAGPIGFPFRSQAVIMGYSARGRVKESYDRVEVGLIHQVSDWALELEQYASELRGALSVHLDGGAPAWPAIPAMPPAKGPISYPV